MVGDFLHSNPKENRFLSGVAALTVSTVLVKIIGLVYKIPMMHCLGAEGMGYFNSAYELYTLFFVIATAGLPVAVSVLISESLASGRRMNVKRIYTVSFALFFFVGISGALLLASCAGVFARMIESPGAELCIAFIAPTVFFISLASAVRGYFQGNQNMMPTAVSQVIEAVGKLLLGVLLATWATRAGWPAERAAALAVLGLVAGSAISMLYLLIRNGVRTQEETSSEEDCRVAKTGAILRRLVALALPVTLGASLSSLTRVVDMTLILRRLGDLGYDTVTATAMFGSYSTLAVPIYHLPTALISGIGVSLVPSLAGEKPEKRDALIGTAIRLGGLVSIPSAFGLAVFSTPILSLLFSGETEAIRLSAPLLAALGVSVPSACLLSVTTSVLQAHKKASLPILSMMAGLAVKVASGYLLMGMADVAMMGAPISTLLCNLTAVGLNFYFIEKNGLLRCEIWPQLTGPVLPSFLAAVTSLAAYVGLRVRMPETGAFLVALSVFGVVYLLSCIKLRVIAQEDTVFLTKGKLKSRIYKGRKHYGTQPKDQGSAC